MSELTELVDGIPDDYVKQPGQWRRKGENGPPIVSDPDGLAVKTGERAGQVRMCTYSRPSNFGKQVENTYNLEKWNERMVALGMAMWPNGDIDDLAVNADPDDRDWRAAADGYVVEAKRLAGAMVAAWRGTHGHYVTEDNDLGRSVIGRIEAGEDVGLPAPLQQAIAEVWQRLIDEHFEVLAVEEPCVFDEWRVAGTLDRIVRLKHDLTFQKKWILESRHDHVVIPAGTVIVLDIKTGGLKLDRNGLPQYWHSYAVQVAAYANSVPYDVDAERRYEWPWEISTEHAVIAHIDIAGALDTDVMTAQLFYVDLIEGCAAGDLVCAAKDWQKRRDVFSSADQYVIAHTVEETPCSITPSMTTAPYTSGLTTTSSTVPSTLSMTTPTTPAIETPRSPNSTMPSPPTRDTVTPRETVTARARRLVDAGHGLRLSYIWPEGVPGFKTDHDHTADELARIFVAIRQVEDEQGMGVGFEDADMTRDTPRHPIVQESKAPPLPAPAPPIVDEGGDIDGDAYTTLKARHANLDSDVIAQIERITAQANAAGMSISLHQRPTQRRYEIARALILWGEVAWDEDILRDVAAYILDCPGSIGWEQARSTDTPLGAVIGAFTIDEARRLAGLADEIANGASLEHDGWWRVVPT